MKIDTSLSTIYESPYAKQKQNNAFTPEKLAPKTTDEKDPTSLKGGVKKAEQVAEKTRVDNEVKVLQAQQSRIERHEEAHQAMGGGGIVYTPMRGPDGKTYHIHGHVSIDTSDGSTPEDTIRKMTKVVAAAMAPSNPSPADIGVATSAIAKRAATQHQIEENLGTIKKMDEKRTDGLKTQVINIKVLGYTVSLYA